MARGDLLVRLVEAGTRGDDATFRQTVEALAAEEREKQHHVLAERLLRSARRPAPRLVQPGPSALGKAGGLLHERVPDRVLADLVLPPVVCELATELVEEQHRVGLLRSHGLEPRHRLLVIGPPGNGKTSLAEAIAGELAVALVVPRYEAIIGSFLGETSERLGHLFDAVSARPCVLLLDEIDVLAKERSDEHETGEIKRVVSTLLLQVDRMPSHVVVVAATNHAELLDRAAWRRFQVRVELPMPSRATRTVYLERVIARSRFRWGYTARTLADKLDGLSFAELEDFVQDVQRRLVLGEQPVDPRSVVRTRLEQWLARARPSV